MMNSFQTRDAAMISSALVHVLQNRPPDLRPAQLGAGGQISPWQHEWSQTRIHGIIDIQA